MAGGRYGAPLFDDAHPFAGVRAAPGAAPMSAIDEMGNTYPVGYQTPQEQLDEAAARVGTRLPMAPSAAEPTLNDRATPAERAQALARLEQYKRLSQGQGIALPGMGVQELTPEQMKLASSQASAMADRSVASSTTKGIKDPRLNQVLAERQKAADLEQRAAQHKAQADMAEIGLEQQVGQQKVETVARLMLEEERKRRALEDRRAQAENVLAQHLSAIQDIDPEQFEKSRTGAQKVAAGLAYFLGGFAEGFSGGRVKSMAGAMLDAAVDRNIAAQRDNMGKATRTAERSLGMLDRIEERLKDLPASMQLERARQFGLIEQTALAAQAATKVPRVAAALAQTSAIAGEKKAKALEDAVQMQADRTSVNVQRSESPKDFLTKPSKPDAKDSQLSKYQNQAVEEASNAVRGVQSFSEGLKFFKGGTWPNKSVKQAFAARVARLQGGSKEEQAAATNEMMQSDSTMNARVWLVLDEANAKIEDAVKRLRNTGAPPALAIENLNELDTELKEHMKGLRRLTTPTKR